MNTLNRQQGQLARETELYLLERRLVARGLVRYGAGVSRAGIEKTRIAGETFVICRELAAGSGRVG